MQGYKVETSDGKNAGHIAGVDGDVLIVERGLLLKHRRPLPRALTNVDDREGVVRATISRELLADAPKVDSDTVDRQAVAAYYGLGHDVDAPGAEGYGEVTPTDPTRGAEQDARDYTDSSAEEERLRVQKEVSSGAGPHDGHKGTPTATGGLSESGRDAS